MIKTVQQQMIIMMAQRSEHHADYDVKFIPDEQGDNGTYYFTMYGVTSAYRFIEKKDMELRMRYLKQISDTDTKMQMKINPVKDNRRKRVRCIVCGMGATSKKILRQHKISEHSY